MKRLLSALVLAALLLSALPVSAGEGMDPLATPTDLCAHENTETVYYFDSPVYSPLDIYTHRVSGPATAETVCTDCGTVISVTFEDNAEEICPHVFRRGKCALCGQESDTAGSGKETVLRLLPMEGGVNHFSLTLTGSDLHEPGGFLVLLAEGAGAAIVLQTAPVLELLDIMGGSLTAEIAAPISTTLNAAVRVYDENGAESAPDHAWTSPRIYTARTADMIVTYTNKSGRESVRKPAWSDAGYFTIPWLGSGTYAY